MQVTITTTVPRDQQRKLQDSISGKGTPVLDYSNFAYGFDRLQVITLARPIGTVIGILGLVLLSFALIPKLGASVPRA